MGTPVYPAALKTYADETNKEDLADAAVINSLQDEVQAIQAELGIDPAGDQTDLKTRLAISIADDGAMKNDTSFPGSPSNGDFFYRSDEDVPYVYNGTTWKAFSAALQNGSAFPTGSDLYDGFLFYRTDQNTLYVYNGSSWDSQGQSLSNVIFSWSGTDSANANTHGHYQGSSQAPVISGGGGEFTFMAVYNTTYRTLLNFKFTKIAGISTITINARLWGRDSGAGLEAILQVDIGGQNNTVKSVTSTTPTWVTSSDIDVSGLSDGTTYDGIVQLKCESTESVYCSAVTLIAS